eukprot:gene32268-16834_t
MAGLANKSALGQIIFEARSWMRYLLPTNKYLAVYYPSGDSVINRMLQLAKPQPSDTLFDLGAGDGRVLIAAAEKHQCKGLGVELCPELVAEARANVDKAKLGHLVQITQQVRWRLDTLFDLGAGYERVLIAAAERHQCKGLSIELCPELVAEARANVDKAKLGHLVQITQQQQRGINARGVELCPELVAEARANVDKAKLGHLVQITQQVRWRLDTLFDLGAGYERVLIAAAERHQCKGLSIELCPELVAEARANVDKAKLGHLVQITQQDAQDADVSSATILALYLSEIGNRKIIDSIGPKLQPGTRIVTHYFPIEGWEKNLVKTCSKDNLSIYLYRVPIAEGVQKK